MTAAHIDRQKLLTEKQQPTLLSGFFQQRTIQIDLEKVEPYPSELSVCPAFLLGNFDDNQNKSCESRFHELSLLTDPENIQH